MPGARQHAAGGRGRLDARPGRASRRSRSVNWTGCGDSGGCRMRLGRASNHIRGRHGARRRAKARRLPMCHCRMRRRNRPHHGRICRLTVYQAGVNACPGGDHHADAGERRQQNARRPAWRRAQRLRAFGAHESRSGLHLHDLPLIRDRAVIDIPATSDCMSHGDPLTLRASARLLVKARTPRFVIK